MRLLLILFIICLLSQYSSADQKDIKSLVIFFRHGSRTTEHRHFHHDEHWKGYEKGDLTKKGHSELHTLG